MCAALAGFTLGKRLPPNVQKFIHPRLEQTAFVLASFQILGCFVLGASGSSLLEQVDPVQSSPATLLCVGFDFSDFYKTFCGRR